MFGFRTPDKKASKSDHQRAPEMSDKAGPSQKPTITERRSIGESDSGKPVGNPKKMTSPPKKAVSVELPMPKATRTLSQDNRAGSQITSMEAVASPQIQPKLKYTDRLAEAKACVQKAKTHLGNSRNIKTEIKTEVTQAIVRLYQLVKEADSVKGQGNKEIQLGKEKESVKDKEPGTEQRKEDEELMRRIEEHAKLMTEGFRKMDGLKEALCTHQKDMQESIKTYASVVATQISPSTSSNERVQQNIEKLVGEVRELRQVTEGTSKLVGESLKGATPSYSEVMTGTGSKFPSNATPKHSIIVSSDVEKDTSDEVLGKVRSALDARASGLQIQRVRKARNQKVVLSCNSREDMEIMAEKISSDRSLKVEEAKNKDPLVIIKDLLSYNTDDDIVASLKSQNPGLLGNVADDHFRATVRYRRRARNPLANHVVLQVSPVLWQKLTSAKHVHIDIQRVTVQDQSPLVQCTRCLGYGHGRKLCKEPADLCSYCGGPHHQAECSNYLVGEPPSCRNCKLAKYTVTGHNAFSGECPIRKRWDEIARSSVAYC